MAVTATPYSDSGSITFGDLLQYGKDMAFDDNTDAGARKLALAANLAIQQSRNIYDFPFNRNLVDGRINLIAPYSTGTVSVTNDSNTVTGSATVFADAHVGGKFLVSGDAVDYIVASVDSTTQITLDKAYQGTTASGSSYEIIFDSYDLPSDFGKLSDRPVSLDGSGPIKVFFSAVDYLDERLNNARTGLPVLALISLEDSKLYLSPAPDETDTIYFSYYKAYAEHSGTSEVVDWPYKYAGVLYAFMDVYIAKMKGEKAGQITYLTNVAKDVAREAYVAAKGTTSSDKMQPAFGLPELHGDNVTTQFKIRTIEA